MKPPQMLIFKLSFAPLWRRTNKFGPSRADPDKPERSGGDHLWTIPLKATKIGLGRWHVVRLNTNPISHLRSANLYCCFSSYKRSK